MNAATSRPEANALEGVRVLEIGSFIAGPFAGQQLGDLGAEIIKIERPDGGDPMRHWRDFGDGDLWWPSIARNKKSVALNLSDPQIRPIFLELIKKCDIVVENFRPGTIERWGIGPDELLEVNPALVITRVSGFGQTGPRSQDPGFGSVGEAMGGIRHLSGWADRPSTRVGISLGDQMASMFAVSGTLAALRHAERTGEGQVVDVAIYEAVFAMMESLVAEYELADNIRTRTGPTLPGVVPSNVYITADGGEVLIAANSDSIYRRLITGLDIQELLLNDELMHHTSRSEAAEYVDKSIADATSQLTTEKLLQTLADCSVPHGRIYTAPDIAEDPHYAARGMIVRREVPQLGNVAMPAPTPKLSRTPGRINSVGPSLGQHTDEVLRLLCGLTSEHLAHLHQEGAAYNKDGLEKEV